MITGGCGFLGQHLCRRLLDEGCEVTCLDDLSTGSQASIFDLIPHEHFKLVVGDVTSLLARVRVPKVDEIYNLACAASPRHYRSEPVTTLRVSVFGAGAVLDFARICGAKVLQASTSEVYGCPEQHPQTEAYWGHVNPIGPRACYDEGKRAAEALFFDYRREFATRIKVARIFNTYGPGMAVGDGRVVSEFIVRALKRQALHVHGNGSQTRSFCYVDDMIEGLIRLMATGDEFTGPVNLGNPEETSVVELAHKVMFLVQGGGLLSGKLPADDPPRRCPDISLAKNILGWEPKVPLEVGLQRTVEYFRKVLKAAA